MDTAHPPHRSFADARSLAPVVREVFGTDRRITAVDRLTGGTRKGVYRVVLDDATSAVVYLWSADEDYWSGLLPDGHDDPADPFSHASGLDLLEGATRRLAAVGARSPRLLFTDRGRARRRRGRPRRHPGVPAGTRPGRRAARPGRTRRGAAPDARPPRPRLRPGRPARRR